MPAWTGFALRAFARDGRIKLYHRFPALDRRIRSTRNNAARLQERLPRVSTDKSLHSQTRRREKQIADCVRWLHRWNHAELRESRQIGRIDNLCVFDPPTRIVPFYSNLSPSDFSERFLVKIENHSVRAIADRVGLDLDSAA